jgi:ABC-2 type transport system permease protein
VRAYFIFLKKELVEYYKTYKLLVMAAAFFIFGLMSPLTAKMMPEIMRWAMESDPTMAGTGMGTMFNNPQAIDAWGQFYNNIGQMGMIVLVVVFSGMLSSELSKGTLTIILTKGLSREAALLSKLTSAFLIWTGCYCLALLVSWGYTEYYFSSAGLPYLVLAVFCMWFFGVFLLALTALMAVLTKTSSLFCMLAVGAAVIVLNILNIIPKVGKFNPVTLASVPMALLGEASVGKDVVPTLAVAGGASVGLVVVAVVLFRKR